MDVDAFGAVVIVVSVTCAVVSVVLFARASRLHTRMAREGRWWLEHGDAEGQHEAIREGTRQAVEDRGESIREGTRQAVEDRGASAERPPVSERSSGSGNAW
jgi:hypothetical protein